MSDTISFSVKGNGWNGKHSFVPDWMERMNNIFYSWKGGELYVHDSNVLRNNYYGQSYPSELSFIMNDAPSDVKLFKTLLQEGNAPWSCTVTTDLNSGSIPSSKFEEKEGDFFAYIRRNESDINLKSLHVIGIGEVDSFTPTSITEGDMDFAFNVDGSTVNQGDKIYRNDSGVNILIGTVESVSGSTITLNLIQNVPVAGDYVFLVKNPSSESDGVRGPFMIVEMSITSDDEVELFAVGSEVIKSYP